MSTTFEEAQVGDAVWSVRFGHGTIDSIYNDPNRPLVIRFSKYAHPRSYTVQGQEFPNELQTLFWQEIKFEAPTKPLSMKHLYSVEPDNQNRILFWQETIYESPEQSSRTFRPEVHRYYYYPSLDLIVHDRTFLAEDDKTDDTCYPCTPEGRKAAVLRIKTLLGVK
jgi:hypothetical protein